MADIYLKRKGDYLIPADQDSLAKIKRLKEDEVYKTSMSKTRSYPFHQKFFALVKLGWDNSPLNMPFNKFRYYCMIKSGHCAVYGDVVIADSIAFDNMKDDEKFQEVYNDVLQFIILHIGADEEKIKNELSNFL